MNGLKIPKISHLKIRNLIPASSCTESRVIKNLEKLRRNERNIKGIIWKLTKNKFMEIKTL